MRFLKTKDTTTGRYNPGEIGVFQEHEANWLISMGYAERAEDTIELASVAKDVETHSPRRRYRKPDGNT